MTDKVLGIKKKVLDEFIGQVPFNCNCSNCKEFRSKFIPVNPKSESVEIEWLKEEIKRQHNNIDSDPTIKRKLDRHWALDNLLTAVKKKAKKG